MAANKNDRIQEVDVNRTLLKELLLDNSPESSDDYLKEAEILDYAISKKGVRNIAVVASFGAGKSSAIETYLRDYRKRKENIFLDECRRKGNYSEDGNYTKVSLASFNDVEYRDGDIERSILQQLLYSQHKGKLPNSRIERTTTTSVGSFLLALFITLFVAMIVLLGLQTGNLLLLQELEYLNWFFLGIVMVSFFILIWFALHFRKFQRIKYKNFELELKDKDDEVKSVDGQSLINRFIDEVLYFFECTKIDLVIFEDLDRLVIKDKSEFVDQSSAIFVKLRELNTIINNSHQCKQKVTFLYAVRDDLIKDQEQRGKFFEFILPIVPVLNPVNTASKMLGIQEKIIKRYSELELDSEFIHSIANRVPNMRVLKNTFNDYMITRDRVFRESSENRLKNENLFALCLYKNLHPYDYSLLEKGRGLIPIVVDRIYLSKNAVKASQEKIKDLESKIARANECENRSFEELKLIMRGQIADCQPDARVRTQKIKFNDIKTFVGLDFTTIEHPQNPNHNYGIQGVTELRLPNGDIYEEREKSLKLKTKEEMDKINGQIEIQKNNIRKYATMSFDELVKEVGIDACFDRVGVDNIGSRYKKLLTELDAPNTKKDFNEENFEDRQHMDFVRFLVQNNLLDENYIEYISSFQSDFLSPSDLVFVKKVQQGSQDFDQKIESVTNVIKVLCGESFSDYAILNNSILENLEEIERISGTKYKKLETLLGKDDNKVSKAIIVFVQTNDDETIKIFLSRILVLHKGIYNKLIESELTKNKKDIVLTALIESGVTCDDCDKNSAVRSYLNELKDYVEVLGGTDIEKAKNFLQQMEPEIKELDKEDSKITKFIVEKNWYKITVNNLKIALKIKDKNSDFYFKNYDFIGSVDPIAKEYIDTKLNEYIRNVFLSEDIPNTKENEKVILEFLRSNIDFALKPLIIEKYIFTINDLSEFDTKLYTTLLRHDRIKPTWDNILRSYVCEADFDIIKRFLLKNAKNITGKFEYNDDGVGKDKYEYACEKFFVSMANADYTKDERIKLNEIADKINVAHDLTDDYKNDDNLTVLIKAGKIAYNAGGLQFLLDKPNSLCQYVVTCEKEIDAEFDNFFNSVKSPTMNTIIFDKRISEGIKKRLFTQHADKMHIEGYERKYFEFLREKGISVPVILFNQFKGYTDLAGWEKCHLAYLVSNRGQNIQEFNECIKNIMPELENITESVEIHIENDIMKKLLKSFADINGINFSSKDGKAILKPKKQPKKQA